MTAQHPTDPAARHQGLLTSLRIGTREHHRQLDSHPLLAVLLQQPDREQYRQALTALARGWLPLEQTLENCLQTSPWRRYFLARRHALTEDLRDLNVTIPDGPGSPPDLRGDRALGALYTLTGAQLGSAMLERTLARHDPTLPLAFFRLRDNNWTAFCRDLTKHQPDEAAPVVDGARATFDYLIAALSASSS